MKRALVTGGSGVLGAAICSALAAGGRTLAEGRATVMLGR